MPSIEFQPLQNHRKQNRGRHTYDHNRQQMMHCSLQVDEQSPWSQYLTNDLSYLTGKENLKLSQTRLWLNFNFLVQHAESLSSSFYRSDFPQHLKEQCPFKQVRLGKQTTFWNLSTYRKQQINLAAVKCLIKGLQLINILGNVGMVEKGFTINVYYFSYVIPCNILF